MELSQQMARLFGQPVIIVDGAALRRPPWSAVQDAGAVINQIGIRSAIAQGLKGPNGAPAPVTTFNGLSGSQQRLYLFCQGGGPEGPRVLVGLLKVGTKSLFHWDSSGQRELPNQLCVLDFYVHEDWQRRGAGKALFASMLQAEDVGADNLAYDVHAARRTDSRRRAARARAYLRHPAPRSHAHLPACPLTAAVAQAARLPEEAL